MLRASRLSTVVLCIVLTASACTTGDRLPTLPPQPSKPTTAAPAATRPVVELAFNVSDDLRSATGRESVTFVPDLAICELVFRAWPNKPATARTGNSLVVTSVSVDGSTVTPQVRSAGAPAHRAGTLVEAPLAACVDAGAKVTAELTFRLVLGSGTDERVGVAPKEQIAWFATAFPLLAWEPGRGWATDAAVDVTGEMATSEVFDLRSLRVKAPSRYQVLATGSAWPVASDPASGTSMHTFTASAVRDVGVTVGRLQTLQREVGGVRLHLGAPRTGTKVPLEKWADHAEQSLRRLTALLGPVPYPDLWISVLPGVADGVEVPGALQFGDLSDPEGLVSHEIAHLWFYGLVGNNQARDPWLDEAFASYAQRIVDGQDSSEWDEHISHSAAGRVGQPMSYWARHLDASQAYVQGVYEAGGSALLEARRRGGKREFDEAVRAYLRDNAHQIVVPADVRIALSRLPDAVQVLEDAGALPGAPALHVPGRPESAR